LKAPRRAFNSTVRRSTVDAYGSIVQRRKSVPLDPQEDIRDPTVVAQDVLVVIETVGVMVVVARVAAVTGPRLRVHPRASAKVVDLREVVPHQAALPLVEMLLVATLVPVPVGEISVKTTGVAAAIETATSAGVVVQHPRARVAVVDVVAAVVVAAAKSTTTCRPPRAAAAPTISTTGIRFSWRAQASQSG
jgi:hypothetical protein